MEKVLVHIEPREIDYIGTSVSAEHILPALDAYVDYREKLAETRIIGPEALDDGNPIIDYIDLGNNPYNAFYLEASDYVLVSKWQNGTMLSEFSTKFIFEIVDNSDINIQVRNTSGDNIRLSYRFYYGG